MQKESHIVSKSGLEWRWKSPLSQGEVMDHTEATSVKGASRVIAAKWNRGSSKIAEMSSFQCRQSRFDQVTLYHHMPTVSVPITNKCHECDVPVPSCTISTSVISMLRSEFSKISKPITIVSHLHAFVLCPSN